MIAYVVRRTLYAIPLALGVIVITFLLFEVVFSPEARAQRELGKGATERQIQEFIRARGWDAPLLLNLEAEGALETVTETRLGDHFGRLITFDFGRSEKTNEDINQMILRGMVPSLTLTVPIFLLALLVSVSLSLTVAFFRGTLLDLWIVVICVAFMSISILVYIIGGQYLLAQHLKLFPVYGYARGVSAARFLLLPVIIAVLKQLGSNVRFYRTVMLEEVGQDYVRTARARGLSERLILFKHVLKNAMIPILTRTVLAIPFLFMGSLLLEKFFGIPGLGSLTVEAVTNGDTRVMAAIVYLGALLYVGGNLATDVSYTLVDPRVRLR
ncbi:MAG: ABC transporter permease [Planctomycetota bacterium]